MRRSVLNRFLGWSGRKGAVQKVPVADIHALPRDPASAAGCTRSQNWRRWRELL